MEIPILIVAILLSCGKSLLMRAVSSSAASKIKFWRTNTIIFLTAFVVTLALSKKQDFSLPSTFTIITACLFAMFTAGAQVFLIYAQSKGGVSLNTFIYSCGFIIPAVYGIITSPGDISVFRIIALVLIVVILYFFILPGKNKISLLWLIYISLSTLFAGLLSIMQNLHQTSPKSGEFGSFLIIAFAVCTIISALAFAFFALKNKLNGTPTAPQPQENPQKKPNKFVKWLPVICGLDVALLNRATLYLARELPSIVFFPVFNASVVIATGVFAALIYKEKLNARQIICLVLSVIPLTLFNL